MKKHEGETTSTLKLDSNIYKFEANDDGTGLFVDISSTTGDHPCFDTNFVPETETGTA